MALSRHLVPALPRIRLILHYRPRASDQSRIIIIPMLSLRRWTARAHPAPWKTFARLGHLVYAIAGTVRRAYTHRANAARAIRPKKSCLRTLSASGATFRPLRWSNAQDTAHPPKVWRAELNRPRRTLAHQICADSSVVRFRVFRLTHELRCVALAPRTTCMVSRLRVQQRLFLGKVARLRLIQAVSAPSLTTGTATIRREAARTTRSGIRSAQPHRPSLVNRHRAFCQERMDFIRFRAARLLLRLMTARLGAICFLRAGRKGRAAGLDGLQVNPTGRLEAAITITDLPGIHRGRGKGMRTGRVRNFELRARRAILRVIHKDTRMGIPQDMSTWQRSLAQLGLIMARV